MSDLFREFVSREALAKSLQSLTGRDDVRLSDDYKVERASSGVEGFTSVILRVKVNYRFPGDDEVKSHVLIVKTMPEFERQREVMKKWRVFKKEGLVFGQVVPLMAKVSAGRVKIPLPVCYHGIYDADNEVIYMEDLVYSGYRLANRSFLFEGSDYPHCSLVMKGLGRFHALSLAAENTLEKGGWVACFPDFDRDYIFSSPVPGDPPGPFQNMVECMIQNLKEFSRELEGLPKEAQATGALDIVLEGVSPTLNRLMETPSDNRRVLIHGDCWLNNMMFRYEKGKDGVEEPVDVKFFDLQTVKVGHPSIDLLFFMFLCTKKSFREKYFSVLIDEYYESLTENLKVIDGSLPPFSLDDLKAEMGEYSPFGHIMSMMFSPMGLMGDDVLLPNVDDMTAEKIEDFLYTGNAAQIKFRFHNDPEFRSKMEEIVRDFIDMALPNGVKSLNSSPLMVHRVI